MSKPLTLSHFLARSYGVEIWEKAAAGWNDVKARREHGDAKADKEVAAFSQRANDARARRDAAPVKIIAVYADGREEVFE